MKSWVSWVYVVISKLAGAQPRPKNTIAPYNGDTQNGNPNFGIGFRVVRFRVVWFRVVWFRVVWFRVVWFRVVRFRGLASQIRLGSSGT